MFTAEQRGSGADERGVSLVPVVISLLSAVAGLSSAAAGFVLDNTAVIVAGMIIGGSGSILINLTFTAMKRIDVTTPTASAESSLPVDAY